jgi:hypothetical protein
MNGIFFVWGGGVEARRLGHAADHSPPSRSEVKNEWSHASIQHLHGLHRDNVASLYNTLFGLK